VLTSKRPFKLETSNSLSIYASETETVVFSCALRGLRGAPLTSQVEFHEHSQPEVLTMHDYCDGAFAVDQLAKGVLVPFFNNSELAY
jgi:hypothetical protein